MYTLVNELPSCVQNALVSVGYGRKDIEIVKAESVSPFDGGSRGRRGFLVLVNIETGERQIHYGSWGGSNMFNPHNQVDLDDRSYPLPPNGCAIKGSQGDKVWATLYLHPSNVLALLPAASETLPEDERRALRAFVSLKASYRKDAIGKEYDRLVGNLVQSGHLSRSKAGAVTITTKGKNAAGTYEERMKHAASDRF